MGGRRVCLLLCGFNDGSGLRDLLCVVSSCVLGYGLYISFFFFLSAKCTSSLAMQFISRPIQREEEYFSSPSSPPLSPPQKEAATALRDIGPYYSHRVEVPPPEGGGSGNELPHKSMEKCRHETGVTQRWVRLLLLTFAAAFPFLRVGGGSCRRLVQPTQLQSCPSLLIFQMLLGKRWCPDPDGLGVACVSAFLKAKREKAAKSSAVSEPAFLALKIEFKRKKTHPNIFRMPARNFGAGKSKWLMLSCK